MADAASKAASRTVLQWAAIEIEVGLFKVTQDKPAKLAEFQTAGPSGGKLMARTLARPTPVEEAAEEPAVEEPVRRSDPLADEQATAIAETEAAKDFTAGDVTVAGEYGRELVEEGTGVVVAPEDVRRGVRLDDGRFIDCTEQLAAIDESTKLDAMRILSFIDARQVDRSRIRGAYYIGAMNERAPKALRLLYEGLRVCQRAAVVKVTKTSRQALGVLVADGRTHTIKMLDLAWAEEVRDAPARAYAITGAKVTGGEVEQACDLVRAMADTRESLDELRDDAVALREELRAKALRGEVAQVIDPLDQAPEEPDELEAALAASIAQVQ